MATTYEAIATTTLASDTVNYTFSSIPATYTDLVLVCSVKSASGEANGDVRISLQFNDDTATNYSTTNLQVYAGSPNSSRDTNRDHVDNITEIERSSGSAFSLVTYNINNYSNTTTYKTVLQRSGNLNNSSQTAIGVSLWRSTSAISKIKIYGGASNASIGFGTGSTFTLYGIKAAI